MNASTHATPPGGGRGQGNGPSELVVHPTTGEVLGRVDELESLPPEMLADALLELDEQAKRLRETRKLLDAELVRRLDVRGRRRWTVGDFELNLETRRESVWDADELELVLSRLVEQGVLEASELVGVIKRETAVSRSAAQRIADRLSGAERRAVEQCRTWQAAGKRRLEVVRSIPLLPKSD